MADRPPTTAEPEHDDVFTDPVAAAARAAGLAAATGHPWVAYREGDGWSLKIAEQPADCADCGAPFDLEVEGGGDEHSEDLWCGECLPLHSCGCPTCDPDRYNDLMLDDVMLGWT